MELGMYTAEIRRPTAGELFRAIRGYGFSQVQFDFASVCDEQMPSEIPPALVEEVASAAKGNGVEIVAVNGTFNMIHPDPGVRREGTKRFAVIANACSTLECGLVTLCTGSRSTAGMWRWHEDNAKEDSWADLLESLSPVMEIAEEQDLILGVEPEASNVVSNAQRARRLLDEIQSSRLKIIMDAANLFQRGEAYPENVRRVIGTAFDLLGSDIILAHGKDILAGSGLSFTSAGDGIVDFEFYLGLLGECGYRGGMILHGMKSEDAFEASVGFIRERLAQG